MKKILATALIISCSMSVFACSRKDADMTKATTTSAPSATRTTQSRPEAETYDETPDFLLGRADREFSGNIFEDNCKIRVRSTPEEFRELVFSYLGGDFRETEDLTYGDYASDVFVVKMSDPNNRIEASCRLVDYDYYHEELYFVFYRTATFAFNYSRRDYWEIYYDGDPGYSETLVLDKTGKIAIETNADPVFVASIMGFKVTENTIAGSINDAADTNLPVPFLSDDGSGGTVTSIDVTDMIKPYSVYGLGPGQTVGAGLEILTERMLRHGFRQVKRTDDQAIYRFNNVTIAFDIREFGTDMQMTGFHIYLEEAEGFTDEELIGMAGRYYESVNGVVPPIIEVDHADGNIVTIHLYDIVELTDSGDEVQAMTQTYDWYTIDRTTGTGEDFQGEEVDLTQFA